MNREQWDRIGSVFDELLRVEEADREAFLAALDDEEMAAELRSLLESHEKPGRFDGLADRFTGSGLVRLLGLHAGHELGHYRIVREIARGGMATVYLAQDSRHERRVALKVLRPELAALLGADRFLQEMKTTARLQHPHILPLFDSGETEGLLYYVMPYIEGESLRDRLEREGPLSVEEAVRIASQVAEALDYAHRQGIIHRDVKPGNILLSDSRALVADFGIALVASEAGVDRTTGTGFSLGTPHYMSPEQAAADKNLTQRSDIYSLGCVLYEMLTGAPPHAGDSASQILRSIVTDEPQSVAELRQAVPPNIVATISQSLEKLPVDRFASAREFGEALADPMFSTPSSRFAAALARSRGRWKRAAVTLAVLAAAATLIAVWSWSRPGGGQPSTTVVEFTLDPPEGKLSFGVKLALSPDGQRLVADFPGDEEVLFQRRLDSQEWQRIPGTEGGSDPFFSPDGDWLGFLSQSESAIKKVPVNGGAVETIARVSSLGLRDWGIGATWGPDDTIVFSKPTTDPTGLSGLFRVNADGGGLERVTTPDTAHRESLHYNPQFARTGDVVLFTAVYEPFEPYVAALSLSSGSVVRLGPGSTPVSDPAGRVAYSIPDRSVVAQDFDERQLSFEGTPSSIADRVVRHGTTASYTISASGSLAYLTGSGWSSSLILVDRTGRGRPLFEVKGGATIRAPRFSPSGDRIAFMRTPASEAESGGDIWVFSVADGTARRLSFEGRSADPAWTSDGRSIGYSVYREGDGSFTGLHLRAADGTGSARQILEGDDHLWQVKFTPGDREVVFFKSRSLYRASLDETQLQVPLLDTETLSSDPALSPDGRWLAYMSNDAGTDEVYVRSYPDMGPATVISVGGGSSPVWSADGTEIFYWGRSQIMAAEVQYEQERVRVAGRTALFDTGPFVGALTRNWDVHPDGEHFVMVGGGRSKIVWRVNALTVEQQR